MNAVREAVSVRGTKRSLPSLSSEGKTIVISGSMLRVASIKDEVCDSGVSNPQRVIEQLKSQNSADVFTFDQKLPNTIPRFSYHFDWDNHALLELQGYEYWWNKQIGNDARRMVRKAEKSGLVTRIVPFSDDLVRGIKSIYDETPIRRGKRFWHYGKSFEDVKTDNGSFLERSVFIGAYLGEELIGFDKIIFTDCWGAQIQLIAKLEHRDKCAINALINKAVQVCEERSIGYLTYGAYVYGKKGADALTDFKKRNGFVRRDYPRYFVPLTTLGAIAVRLGLYKSPVELLPTALVDLLLKLRAQFYGLAETSESASRRRTG